MKREYMQKRCHREPQTVRVRYGLLYGMGFGEQTETKKRQAWFFRSKRAGGKAPLKSRRVLACHERMQSCIKQGGTAGMNQCPVPAKEPG